MQRIFFESHDMQDKIYILHHRFLEKKPSGHLSDFNWHENIELAYIVNGNGTILCDGHPYPVKGGDVFVYNSNHVHRCYTDNTMEYYCLIVQSDFLKASGIPITELRMKNLIQDGQARCLFTELVEETYKDSLYAKAICQAKILSFIVYLLRSHGIPSTVPKGISDTPGCIKTALEFMHQKYAGKISLEEIAATAGLSKCHFAREFKKATHMTVTSYLNMIRCQHANQLIAGQGYSVQEAAFACGFNTPSFFSKTFYDIMGYLPSEAKTKR